MLAVGSKAPFSPGILIQARCASLREFLRSNFSRSSLVTYFGPLLDDAQITIIYQTAIVAVASKVCVAWDNTDGWFPDRGISINDQVLEIVMREYNVEIVHSVSETGHRTCEVSILRREQLFRDFETFVNSRR